MRTKGVRQLNREQLKKFKTDSEFEAFVLDYYPEIKGKFSSGMDRTSKANLLIESIDPNELHDCLLDNEGNISSVSPDVKNTPSMIETRPHGSHLALPATQGTMFQSQLPGLPGQSAQDQVIIAAGGSPVSPLGALLYKKS